MPAIRTNDEVPNPARVLTEAINRADEMGLIVTTGADLGVMLTSRNPPLWEPDPRARGVSPLGAVLLLKQPQILDLELAISNAMGMGIPWCSGLEEGCADAKASKGWSESNAAGLYNEGRLVGKEFRTHITTAVCKQHRVRYVRAVGCPRCAGVTVEAAAQLPPELSSSPPMKLIGRLLSTLTLAEALEAVVETIPGRPWPIGTKADVVEDLRESAAEYRAQGL